MGRISMPQGKGSLMHNRREYERYGMEIPKNIDTGRSFENEFIVDRDIRKAYEEIFGNALNQYNEKQKREDRKIKDYYDHIAKSKNREKFFYEDVLQWGAREDFQEHPELRETAAAALREYVRTFEQRNPNLKLIGAYLHMDEVSPHVHIDYVPVASGYKSGLSVRNSLDRAMKQMGYIPQGKESKKNNATKLWKEHERAYFAGICESMGLTVDPERPSQRKSLSVDEYKDAKERMKSEIDVELNAERQLLAAEIEHMDSIVTVIRDATKSGGIKSEDYTIPEKKSLLGRVESPERKGVFVEGLSKDDMDAALLHVQCDDGLRKIYDSFVEKGNAIIAQAHTKAAEIVAQAQAVFDKRDSIIQEAKDWANNLKLKHKPLADEVNDLTLQKRQLTEDIQLLSDARQVLRSDVRNAAAGEFVTLDEYFSHPEAYRELQNPVESGCLFVQYADGTIVSCKGDSHRTAAAIAEDQRNGKCVLGCVREREVSVPLSMVKRWLSHLPMKYAPASLQEEMTIRGIQTAVATTLENPESPHTSNPRPADTQKPMRKI